MSLVGISIKGSVCNTVSSSFECRPGRISLRIPKSSFICRGTFVSTDSDFNWLWHSYFVLGRMRHPANRYVFVNKLLQSSRCLPIRGLATSPGNSTPMEWLTRDVREGTDHIPQTARGRDMKTGKMKTKIHTKTELHIDRSNNTNSTFGFYRPRAKNFGAPPRCSVPPLPAFCWRPRQ